MTLIYFGISLCGIHDHITFTQDIYGKKLMFGTCLCIGFFLACQYLPTTSQFHFTISTRYKAVCCLLYIESPKHSLNREDEQTRIQRLRDKMAAAGTSPVTFTMGSPSPSEIPGPSRPSPVPPATDTGLYTYRLSQDEDQNDTVREDFYYEHVSLNRFYLF